ncbi:MAG: hypothetical protein QM756_46340 [Polyangiaceae bacterium]
MTATDGSVGVPGGGGGDGSVDGAPLAVGVVGIEGAPLGALAAGGTPVADVLSAGVDSALAAGGD